MHKKFSDLQYCPSTLFSSQFKFKFSKLATQYFLVSFSMEGKETRQVVQSFKVCTCVCYKLYACQVHV